jgi:hypothetical protein
VAIGGWWLPPPDRYSYVSETKVLVQYLHDPVFGDCPGIEVTFERAPGAEEETMPLALEDAQGNADGGMLMGESPTQDSDDSQPGGDICRADVAGSADVPMEEARPELAQADMEVAPEGLAVSGDGTPVAEGVPTAVGNGHAEGEMTATTEVASEGEEVAVKAELDDDLPDFSEECPAPARTPDELHAAPVVEDDGRPAGLE